MMPAMKSEDLQALQAPLMARHESRAARLTLTAWGTVGGGKVSCSVQTARAPVEAGLHPATGGTGGLPCSGDLLLQAVVACAGVTLTAVAAALGIILRGGEVMAEGDLVFRGELAVARDPPVGFTNIRLRFALDTDASPDEVETLVALTERYCVVLQTLRSSPRVTAAATTAV
jgi:uncharacterized OsmC-like protein